MKAPGYWFKDTVDDLLDTLSDTGISHVSSEFIEALAEEFRAEDNKREEFAREPRTNPQTGFEE
jgi:hypothetical protein